MAEYIEREAAIAAAFTASAIGNTAYRDVYDTANRLRLIPAADVVPVVRCKDCRYWDRARISCEGLARCLTGESGIRYRKADDFCSRVARI